MIPFTHSSTLTATGPGETLGNPWPPLAVRPRLNFSPRRPCPPPSPPPPLFHRTPSPSRSPRIPSLDSHASTQRQKPDNEKETWILAKRGPWGLNGGVKTTSLLTQRCFFITVFHRRMARGLHGLPKVSPGPAMPYPSTLCGWAIALTAFWPFEGWPARRVGSQGASFTPSDATCRTPMFITVCKLHSLGRREKTY
jgi:hypothetical protein